VDRFKRGLLARGFAVEGMSCVSLATPGTEARDAAGTRLGRRRGIYWANLAQSSTLAKATIRAVFNNSESASIALSYRRK
jgi:hypothetical protein